MGIENAGLIDGFRIYRWIVADAPGWMLVRENRGRPGVVAVTVDGIEFGSTYRTTTSTQTMR